MDSYCRELILELESWVLRAGQDIRLGSHLNQRCETHGLPGPVLDGGR